MNFSFLISASDSKFAIDAMSDYLRGCQQEYQKVLDLCNQTCLLEDESPTLDTFKQMVSDQGFNPECAITVADHDVKLSELLFSIYNGVEDYADTEGSLDFDVVGNQVNFTQIVDEFTSTMHSLVVMWAANLASMESTFADRLTVFRDKVSSIFADGYADLSNTLSYWEEALRNVTSTEGWLHTVKNAIGIDKVSSGTVISETSLYQFTGASPVGALDFSSVSSAVFTVTTIAATAVVGIMDGIGKLVKTGFEWIKGKFIEVVNDPDDLYIVDSSADDPTINGLTTCLSDTVDINMDTRYWHPLDVDGELADWIYPNRTLLQDQWLHFKLICGDIFIKFTDIGTYQHHVIFGYESRFKPFVLDPLRLSQFKGYSTSTFTNVTENDDESGWTESFERLKSINPYADSDTSEVDKLNGLVLATEWLSDICVGTAKVLTGKTPGNLYSMPRYITPYSSATNADFAKWASGMKREGGQYVEDTTVTASLHSAIVDFFFFFALQQKEKQSTPLNYTFIPYRRDCSDFKSSKWAIKTDAQNWELFNKVATITITALVIIIATIYIGVKVRKLQRKFYFKRASFVGQMDNKMWNGGTLTSAEQRKYIRYSRKLSASTLITKATESAASKVQSIYDQVNEIASNLPLQNNSAVNIGASSTAASTTSNQVKTSTDRYLPLLLRSITGKA